MARERLQKVMAAAGVDSRRKCEELILQGAVKVNKRVMDTLPVFVDPDVDVITVYGRRIRPSQKVYYLLNKPKGFICTNRDPGGRRLAIDLVPDTHRVFCVGRLDIDSAGLVLITNDTETANRLTHPRYGVVKRYTAIVKGDVEEGQIERLRKGVYLAEGKAVPSAVKVLHRSPRESIIEITLKQGLTRQIRPMLLRVGLDVKTIRRTRIGRLDIRGLGPGRWRMLTAKEIEYLRGLSDLRQVGGQRRKGERGPTETGSMQVRR